MQAAVKTAIAKNADGCRLLASFLRSGVEEQVVSRAARFGILLLQGVEEVAGWPSRSSAACQEACLINAQSTLYSSGTCIQRGLRDLLQNSVNNKEGNLHLRYVAGTRVLRVLQLLCENQFFRWQNELQRAAGVNVVADASTLFATFATQVRECSPTAAAMRGMQDDDARITATDASVRMLSQFCDTITEFIIGPNVKNQVRVRGPQVAHLSQRPPSQRQHADTIRLGFATGVRL